MTMLGSSMSNATDSSKKAAVLRPCGDARQLVYGQQMGAYVCARWAARLQHAHQVVWVAAPRLDQGQGVLHGQPAGLSLKGCVGCRLTCTLGLRGSGTIRCTRPLTVCRAQSRGGLHLALTRGLGRMRSACAGLLRRRTALDGHCTWQSQSSVVCAEVAPGVPLVGREAGPLLGCETLQCGLSRHVGRAPGL